ncbi:MAG: ABC-F family ATP-binding cassette domain-containing protein [Candidatus Eremiobacteraeota bacterium]|nr:ABC-F family ATP-binding cassette domain-containing protein [Candidatus Eremiobacteraeota bacterium]
MELLRFAKLDCDYGAQEVFSGISGVLDEGERVAIVGPNGAGKSSLLRLLAGVDEVYGGQILRAKEARCAYLAQSAADQTEATLQQLLDAALSRASDDEWGLQNKILRAMLARFGFSARDYARPLRQFSGGQRAKAELARVLIDRPDYFILDEPTNHLDIAAVRWLESFIAADSRAYIIVSHDRYFIDRVATRVWELDAGRLHIYAARRPAYTQYQAQRQERLGSEQRAYLQFVGEQRKRQQTIANVRATRTSSDYSQVRSREKQLARFEASQVVQKPSILSGTISVRLQSARRATSGFVFEAESLEKSFESTLFTALNLNLQQGERLAVVGPNGAGKTTFLKILAGELQADCGAVRYNPAIRIAYYMQNAHDTLDGQQVAVDAVMEVAPVTPQEARALLGRMRISGDASEKPVEAFSGGERRRIMLARLMAQRADVLLLDEPTNDLDIESREALESVLDEYEGALVVVSHDRYLLARLADRVLWLDGGQWGTLDGGYDAYESLQRERTGTAGMPSREEPQRPKASRLTPLKIRSKLESRITRLESEIATLDARKHDIETLFSQPALYQEPAQVKALQQQLVEIAAQSEAAVVSWESLLKELEELAVQE